MFLEMKPYGQIFSSLGSQTFEVSPLTVCIVLCHLNLCSNDFEHVRNFSCIGLYIYAGIRISSNCVEFIFVKVHLSTSDAVFYSFCQMFQPWGFSSATDVGLQGVFIYRHLFPPFLITSSVMLSITSFRRKER